MKKEFSEQSPENELNLGYKSKSPCKDCNVEMDMKGMVHTIPSIFLCECTEFDTDLLGSRIHFSNVNVKHHHDLTNNSKSYKVVAVYSKAYSSLLVQIDSNRTLIWYQRLSICTKEELKCFKEANRFMFECSKFSVALATDYVDVKWYILSCMRHTFTSIPLLNCINQSNLEIIDDINSSKEYSFMNMVSGEITACTGQDIVDIINGNELKSAAVDVYLTILANTAFSNDRRVLVVQTHDFSLLRRDWAGHRLYLKLYKKHAHVKYDYAIAVCNLGDVHWVLLFYHFKDQKLYYMDSLKHDINSQCTYLFLEYISILSNVLYQTSIDNLKIVELAKQDNFVNQTDNKNCGIFCCRYAKMFILSCHHFVFTNFAFTLLRSQIKVEVLSEEIQMPGYFREFQATSLFEGLPDELTLALSDNKNIKLTANDMKDSARQEYETLLKNFVPPVFVTQEYREIHYNIG